MLRNEKKVRKGEASAGPKQKRPRRPKNEATSADGLLRAQGQRGTDIRSPTRQTDASKREHLVQPGSNLVLPVTCTYYDRAVSYLAMGIVLKAMQKGYKWTDTTFGDCPYYAFRYLIDIIKNAMKGDIPQIQQAPLWFWDLLYALKQKTVNFKTAQIKYSWEELVSGQGDEISFTLGTGVDDYAIFWGVSAPGTALVNGVPTLVAPPPYAGQGPTAFNKMLSFFSGEGSGKMVGDPGKSPFDRDSSAFAAVFPEIGESFFSPGACKVSVQSERQIDSPILAKFAQYQSGVYRGWQQEKVSAGSSCYLGGRCVEFRSLNEWRNKTPPIFKVFNFDEFYYALSKTLSLALEGATLTPVEQCPLTPLQVQLILRQALLPYFSNELAQDLRLQGPDWVDMLPFTVGPNGCNYGRAAMLVPTLLAENIRCCQRMISKLKGKTGRQILDIVPVLARSPERPALGNFTFGPNGTLLYSDAAVVDVDLVDLSATVDQQTYYLDLNSEPYIAMVNAWNEWISKYQNCLSSLVPLNGEGGAEALCTLVYTRLQKEVKPSFQDTMPTTTAGVVLAEKALAKKGSKKRIAVGCDIPRKNKGVGAAPVPGTSYLDTVGDARTCGILGFNRELWPYISLFILPVSWSETQSGIAAAQAVQVFNCEASFIDSSSANSSYVSDLTPSVQDRLNNLASMDIKQLGQDGDNSLVAGLKTLDKRGQGGFFTSIAGMIGDALGVPEVKKIASAVGGLTGL